MRNKLFILEAFVLCTFLMISYSEEGKTDDFQNSMQTENNTPTEETNSEADNKIMNGNHTYYALTDDAVSNIWNHRKEENLDVVLELIYNCSSEKKSEENLPYLILNNHNFEGAWAWSSRYGDKYNGKGTYHIENHSLYFDWSDFSITSYKINETTSEETRASQIINLLNKSNSYPFICDPPCITFDKNLCYCVFPTIMQNGRSNILINALEDGTISENMEIHPKIFDTLLCSDTYGLGLDGTYQTGNPFILQYNPQELDDTFHSEYSYSELLMNNLESLGIYATEDTKYHIDFSDNTWSWYTENGDLINTGAYQESLKIKGLISIYLTDDSVLEKYVDNDGSKTWRRTFVQYSSVQPLFLLYIAEDGNIYYPDYFTIEQNEFLNDGKSFSDISDTASKIYSAATTAIVKMHENNIPIPEGNIDLIEAAYGDEKNAKTLYEYTLENCKELFKMNEVTINIQNSIVTSVHCSNADSFDAYPPEVYAEYSTYEANSNARSLYNAVATALIDMDSAGIFSYFSDGKIDLIAAKSSQDENMQKLYQWTTKYYNNLENLTYARIYIKNSHLIGVECSSDNQYYGSYYP